MRFDVNLKADLSKLSFTHQPENNTRMMVPTITAKMTRDEAEKLIGKEFTASAFGGMSINDEGEVVWAYKSITPAFVCEQHRVKLAGEGEIVTMPEVATIRPVKGERSVLVDIKLPAILEPGKHAIAGALAIKIGDSIDVHMCASQGALPFSDVAKVAVKAGPFGNDKVVEVK